MRGLSFIAGGELYAVDVTLVEKVARKLAITPVPSAPYEVIGIANLKGRVVTIMSLIRLLGIDEGKSDELNLNSIVFKSGSGGDNQLGLAVEKPGNLIDITDDAVRMPNVTTGTEESFCISGVTEIDDKFYRIIDIEAIQRKYSHGVEAISGNSSYGGTENEQII